jgi:hypothetical protein
MKSFKEFINEGREEYSEKKYAELLKKREAISKDEYEKHTNAPIKRAPGHTSLKPDPINSHQYLAGEDKRYVITQHSKSGHPTVEKHYDSKTEKRTYYKVK